MLKQTWKRKDSRRKGNHKGFRLPNHTGVKKKKGKKKVALQQGGGQGGKKRSSAGEEKTRAGGFDGSWKTLYEGKEAMKRGKT